MSKLTMKLSIFVVLVFGIGIALFIYKPELFSFLTIDKDLEHLGYSEKSIELIKENNMEKEVVKSGIYSKTLEVALSGSYNKEYLDEYLNIKYIKQDKFIKSINSLISLDYSYKDINLLINNKAILSKYTKTKINNNYLNNDYIKNINSLVELGYSITDINIILDKVEKSSLSNIEKYNKNLIEYFEFRNYRADNLKRYINYSIKKPKLSNEKVILYVNMNLDRSFYTNISSIEASNQSSLTVLVNKYYKLSSSYKPNDLVALNSCVSGTKYVRKEAASHYEEMCGDLKKEGLEIFAMSTYRSYSNQKAIYNNYVSYDGVEKADTYSARAGHSEHQTGLALDVASSSLYIDDFENSKEYTWMIDNSYKYGFVLSYPKDKVSITGYQFESWHYRYVGIELAKELHDKKITLDEFYASL